MFGRLCRRSTYQCARTADLLAWRIVHPRPARSCSSATQSSRRRSESRFTQAELESDTRSGHNPRACPITLDTQLSIAAQIQRHLLPPNPVGSNGVQRAGRLSRPIASAAIFTTSFLPRVTACSSSAMFRKGIPAALLQASAHSLFRTLARNGRPADLLDEVSRDLRRECRQLYLTCLVVHVDSANGRLARQRRSPGGSVGRIVGASAPVAWRPAGLFPETTYESEVVSINAAISPSS